MKIRSTLKSTAFMIMTVLLTLLVLSVHQAYAASCFTDTGGHWAESFICWMKTTGLSSGYPDGTFRPDNSITRAEVAALLYKEASGDTYISIGPDAWHVNAFSPGNAYIEYGPTDSALRSTSTGSNAYLTGMPLITTLHNQQMTVKGAKLCYDASFAGGSITGVFANLIDGSTGLIVASLSDPTTRTDKTCRVYSFATPPVLVGTDSLVMIVSTNLVATSNFVDVYGVTAVEGFSPTAGVLAPSPSFPATILGATP